MFRTATKACYFFALHLVIWHAPSLAQQRPIFAEFRRQASIVQLPTRDLDDLMCWIAQDQNQFEVVYGFAKGTRDRVLLRKLSVAIASDGSWKTIQKVIDAIGDSGSTNSLSQADLASVQILSKIQDAGTQRKAFEAAMKKIERCNDAYASTFLLNELAGYVFDQEELSGKILTLFKSKLKLLDRDEANSISDDFLRTVARNWGDREVQLVLNGFGSGKHRDESNRIAIARGSIEAEKWQNAYFTTISVNSPNIRAELLLNFANCPEQSFELLSPSSKVHSQFRKALANVDSDIRKLELTLTLCEAALKHRKPKRIKWAQSHLLKFVRNVTDNELNNPILFQKLCRAFVIIADLQFKPDADFALEKLIRCAKKLAGTERDVKLALIAEHAVLAKHYDDGVAIVQLIKAEYTRSNCVCEIAKTLGKFGDRKTLDRFRACCDTSVLADRINTTTLTSLVKHGHFRQAEELLATIRPDQTQAFAPILSLVRQRTTTRNNQIPRWLGKLKARSHIFRSLVYIAEWSASMDQDKLNN
jgi:hypothetical protein